MSRARTAGAVGGAARGAAIGTQFMPGWGTAIGAVVGGVAGLLGGDVDSSVTRQQIRILKRQAREAKRTKLKQMEQAIGATDAGIGASNIQFSGSALRYRHALEQNYRRTIAFEQEDFRMQQRLVSKGGQAQQKAATAGAVGDMIGGFGALAGASRDAGWWGD